MSAIVQGLCEDFCPKKERELRIREHLLHYYELKDGQRNSPGSLVKSFSRSAAGIKMPKAEDLRTKACLWRTVEYLLTKIILDKRKSFNYAYEFIFDRMRAVRQEIVMQNFTEQQTIKLMEPVIVFLAYSRYRLCEEPIDKFDPKICDQHLQECLKTVLRCYDSLGMDKNYSSNLAEEINRSFIEGLYQIFNLGSTEALERAINLSETVRSNQIFASVLAIAKDFYLGNFYRTLNGIQMLPHILCAVASLHIPKIRRKMFEVFATAYNSAQLTVPKDFICRIFHYENSNMLMDDCKYYGLKTTADNAAIHFKKADFKTNLPELKPKNEYFVEQKLLKIYLPEVLLLKNLKINKSTSS